MKYTVDESREWYNKLPSKRSAAAMIVRSGDTVLMVKDDYKGAMTFPGGVIDPSESPQFAAVRETREETTLDIPIETTKFFTVAYVPEVNGFLDRFHFFFAAEVSNEAKTTVVTEAGIEYDAWVPIDQIAEKAGNRPTYVAIQEMLLSRNIVPYFEAQSKGGVPWQS